MKNRIKQIRKDNQLTPIEFGKRIGVKENTIIECETGLKNPTDAMILSICREFRIREDWLRNGKEPMKKIPTYIVLMNLAFWGIILNFLVSFIYLIVALVKTYGIYLL